MAKALDNLNASIVALTAAVDRIPPSIPPSVGATEAEVQAASDAIAAQVVRIDGLTGTTTPKPTP